MPVVPGTELIVRKGHVVGMKHPEGGRWQLAVVVRATRQGKAIHACPASAWTPERPATSDTRLGRHRGRPAARVGGESIPSLRVRGRTIPLPGGPTGVFEPVTEPACRERCTGCRLTGLKARRKLSLIRLEKGIPRPLLPFLLQGSALGVNWWSSEVDRFCRHAHETALHGTNRAIRLRHP